MTGTELLQLVVCLLFPVGLLALFLWNIGKGHGRTGRDIAAHLAIVVGCLAGVVLVGWGLSVSRGGPILLYEAGDFGFGGIRPLDVVGLAACVALLGAVLWIVRRLSRPASEPDVEAEARSGRV